MKEKKENKKQYKHFFLYLIITFFAVFFSMVLFASVLAPISTAPSASTAPAAMIPGAAGIPQDTLTPTVPTNLSADIPTSPCSSLINLYWNPSDDDVGVVGYNIYRNGAKIGTSTLTHYTDSFATSGTTYSYTVSAYDASGKESAKSSSISATAPQTDTTSPTVTITNPIFGDSVSGTFPFTADASDNNAVSSVTFYIAGQPLGESVYSPYEVDFNTLAITNGTYKLYAVANDVCGNPSSSNSQNNITIEIDNPFDAGGVYCGNGVCNFGEDSTNCPQDCPTNGGGGGGGGGSGGCITNSDCGSGNCMNGQCEPALMT